MRAISLLLLFVAAVSLVHIVLLTELLAVHNIWKGKRIPPLTLGLNPLNYCNRKSKFCGGTILNQRSILTAAHCFDSGRNIPARWRFRVGSAFASSGGVVHNVNQIIRHPSYNQATIDSDVTRSATTIVYINNAVQAASIASATYKLADNQVVWAAGWGVTETGAGSEQLRHVQIWSINQATYNQRYGGRITANMLCSGWLDVGGRDQCQGASGGPHYHNGVVVGVSSWGIGCASAYYPGVNARVSHFTA